MVNKICRFCKTPLNSTFVDLGVSPFANSFLEQKQLYKMEPFYPLQTYVCENCFLVQLDQFESPSSIFSQYAYFSSFSSSWLEHSKHYSEMMINDFNLNQSSQVIEIASNDGYLLQFFLEKGIPVMGIEPAQNVAQVAIEKGISTKIAFFGNDLAQNLVSEGLKADVIIANNVLAHAPNLIDFISGLKILLKENGVITIEIPHLLKLITLNQFDTIYHEHFSYFSLMTVDQVFSAFDLKIVDVEEIATHGGSIRLFIKHNDDHGESIDERVLSLIEREKISGLDHLETYVNFTNKVESIKYKLLQLLIEIRLKGETIVGYGAPAKGNTLLNYCGVGKEFISYTVDKNNYKQGLFLPGTHIPIKKPEEIKITKPEYIFILPWNIKEEIMDELSFIRDWNGKFLIAIPDIQIL